MTDSPPPTNPRRRWIVIAVSVLLLAVVWRLWPQNPDARFVGTWDWTDEQIAGRGGVLTLYANGSAVGSYAGHPETVRTRWNTDGDRFLYGDGIGRQSGLVSDFDSVVIWLTGTTRFRVGVASWTIEAVDDDRIVLTSGTLRWTLIRKPDVPERK